VINLHNGVRELLYFLYDFKFFDAYNIQNESSLIKQYKTRHSIERESASSRSLTEEGDSNYMISDENKIFSDYNSD